MTLPNSWHSSCLAHITVCSSYSSLRRCLDDLAELFALFTACIVENLSHRTALTTKNSLCLCVLTINLKSTSESSGPRRSSNSSSRSRTAPPLQQLFCRVPSTDAGLHIIFHKRQNPGRPPPFAGAYPQVAAADSAAVWVAKSFFWMSAVLSLVLHQNSCLFTFNKNASRFLGGSTTSQSESYKTSQAPFTEENGTVTSGTERGTSGTRTDSRKENPTLSTPGTEQCSPKHGQANVPRRFFFFSNHPL